MAIQIVVLLAFTCMQSIIVCDAKGDTPNILGEVEGTSVTSQLKMMRHRANKGASSRTQATQCIEPAWTGHGTEFAGIVVQGQIKDVRAALSIFKPEEVKDGQYSSIFVAIENGQEQIKAGWMVNPCLHSDAEVHFFTSYKGGNHATCVDTSCSAFHQTNTGVKLGDILTPSNVGHSNTYLDIHISKDENAGHWYLGANSQVIGYWQGDYFSSLKGEASTIRFGGEVYTPSGWAASPPMGSGIFQNGNPLTTCHFQKIIINADRNGHGGYVPQNPDVKEARCYFVGNFGRPPFEGYGFSVGGTGGKDQETCVYPPSS